MKEQHEEVRNSNEHSALNNKLDEEDNTTEMSNLKSGLRCIKYEIKKLKSQRDETQSKYEVKKLKEKYDKSSTEHENDKSSQLSELETLKMKVDEQGKMWNDMLQLAHSILTQRRRFRQHP